MISASDSMRFDSCCRLAMLSEHERSGIGTLGERTLHVILKHFFEPDTVFHEVRVGRYVADICRGNEITEIQTRGFAALRQKLIAYCGNYHVNVVYPIAQKKYISWLDPDSGELSKHHKSPKVGKVWDFLYELYALRPIMPLNRVRFTLVMCEMEEFRLLDGWSNDKKRGSTRHERIPTALYDIITLSERKDYAILIPESLGDSFTTADFAKAAQMTRKTAGYAVRTLETIGVVEKTDRIKNTRFKSVLVALSLISPKNCVVSDDT